MLKELRVRSEKTQEEMATAIGVSRSLYARFESGIRQPSLVIGLKLVEVYGLQPAAGLELLRELAGLPAEPTPAGAPTDPRQAALPIRSAA